MNPSFDLTAASTADRLLASRPDGIQLNGSQFAAVAGSSGFAAVTATEVAYEMKHEAARHDRRWRNCNHRTVGDALSRGGFHQVYAGGKTFYLRDAGEAARLLAASREKTEAKRGAHRKEQAAFAALVSQGPTVTITVRYAKNDASWRSRPKREIRVLAANVLDECARFAKGKAVSITVGSAFEWVMGSARAGWTWEREQA